MSKTIKKPPNCEKIVCEINILFDIDISNESSELFSPVLCNKCYNKIAKTRKIKDSKKRYELFEKERNQLNSITYLWVKHTENVTCRVCEIAKTNKPNFGKRDNKTVTSIATSPTRLSQEKSLNDILQRNSESPLDKDELKALNHLLKRQEKQGVVICPTGGQPKQYIRVTNPRKNSTLVSDRVVKNRSRDIAQIRERVAGNDVESVQIQQASEISSQPLDQRKNIIKQSGISSQIRIPSTQTIAMKSGVGLTYNQLRNTKRYLKEYGVQFENEKRERIERNSILETNDLCAENGYYARA